MPSFLNRSRENSSESQIPEPPSSQPPTIRESLQEAAEQIAHGTALQDALELVLVGQMRDIADDELETVRQYRQQKMNVPGASTQPPGSSKDLIVAKDMHFHQPQTPPQTTQTNTAGYAIAGGSGIIAAAIMSGTGLLAASLLRSDAQPEKITTPPAAVQTIQADPGSFGIGKP